MNKIGPKKIFNFYIMKRNNYNKNEVIDNYRTGRTISIIIIIILIFVCNNLWKDNKYILSETNEYLQNVKKLTDENIILKKQIKQKNKKLK